MLSKSKGNFMFWTISYLRKLNKYKWQFSDNIVYQYHTSFYVYHRPKNRPNGMWKKISLLLDSSKKNDGSISFFIFSNLQWISAFTEFPSTGYHVIITFLPTSCYFTSREKLYLLLLFLNIAKHYLHFCFYANINNCL